MKHIRIILLVALGMLVNGCGIFGGDDTADLSSTAAFTPEPTANVVQAVPADDTTAADGTGGAPAPLPTGVTIPATPVPPEPTPDRSQPMSYVVQSGDVLGLIAERFDVDIAELRRVNGLSGNLIRVGQSLTIPALEGLADDSGGDGEVAEGTESPAPSAPAPTSEPAAPVSCGANAVGHCVQPGDTLLGIALKYGVSVDDLRAANPAITGDTIRVGDLLNLPGGSSGGDTSGGDTSGGDAVDVTPTVDAPRSSADCEARNPEYPYFHSADGLCYANPIGTTPIPTSAGADTDVDCPKGTFLWEDGLCYPIPGYEATPEATQTPVVISPDYGTAPCATPYFVANETGKCLLTEEGVDAGKQGAGTPQPTTT